MLLDRAAVPPTTPIDRASGTSPLPSPLVRAVVRYSAVGGARRDGARITVRGAGFVDDAALACTFTDLGEETSAALRGHSVDAKVRAAAAEGRVTTVAAR